MPDAASSRTALSAEPVIALVIGTFAADSTSPKLVSMPISAAQLGTADMSEITLDVDQTFTPGSGDVRELGIRVFHTYVEPK